MGPSRAWYAIEDFRTRYTTQHVEVVDIFKLARWSATSSHAEQTSPGNITANSLDAAPTESFNRLRRYI